MSTPQLPSHPDVEQYRKQAKELLRQCRSGDPSALDRLRGMHPHAPTECRLADAQLVIAREHGAESWPKFLKAVEAATGRLSSRQVWRAAERAVVDGDVPTLERFLRDYAGVFHHERPQSTWNNTLTPYYETGNAREIVRSTHEFETWRQYEAFVAALKANGSPEARFEAAADAIVGGEIKRLRALLQSDPELIRTRSKRRHHATLLHYVGANGVEGFRQHTPRNAVEILELLLASGAEVDAVADMYGWSTTLGLVATSRHPRVAGLQETLIDRLLAHGARLDFPRAAGHGQSLVNACLANGQPSAAAHLASRGAPLDPEGAGGVGRIDVLARCFTEDGHIEPPATMAQMEAAMVAAAGTRHRAAAEFLLDRGVPVDASARGFTGVNSAALNGDLDTLRLFVARSASLEIRNEYGGTALDAALWGAVNLPPESATSGATETDFVVVIETLLKAGANVEPSFLSWWDKQDTVRPDLHARIAELLRAGLRNR